MICMRQGLRVADILRDGLPGEVYISLKKENGEEKSVLG